MNPTAIYSKSGKGVQEASGKTSHLNRADRAVLSAIDGRATLADVAQKVGKGFDNAFKDLIQKLDRDGFIREASPGVAPKAAAPGAKPAGKAAEPSGGDLDFSSLGGGAPPKASPPPPSRPAAPPPRPAAPPPPPPPPPSKPSPAAEAQAKAQQSALQKAREEAEARADAERQRIKSEAEAKMRAEMEAKAKDEAAVRLKQEAEAKAKAEAEAKIRAAQEAAARVAAEAKAKADAEAKARVEAERKAREEAERARKAAEEEARKAREEAERARKAAEEEARKAREEAERARKAAEEEARKAREEAERVRKAAEEERKREEAERAARRKREEEEEAERRRAREEEDRRHEEERAAKRRQREEEDAREAEEAAAARTRKKKKHEEEAPEPAAEPAAAPAAAPAKSEAASGLDSLLNDLDAFTTHEETERKEREEAERKAKEAAEQRAREEAERREKEEAERREKEEARARKQAEKQRKREEEEALAKKREAEEARLRQEEERRKKEADERARKAKEEEVLTARATRGPATAVGEDTDEVRKRMVGRRAGAAQAPAYQPVRRKKSGWGMPVAIGLVVLLAAAVGVIHVMPVSTAEYERAASEAIGRPVKVGSASYSLLSGGLQIKLSNIRLGDDVRIASGSATPELGALRSEKKKFTRIDLEGVQLPQEAIGEALFAKVLGENFAVERVVIRKLELTGAAVLPKPLEAELFYGVDGSLTQAKVRGPDVLSGTITPKGGALEFDVTASGFPLPVLPDVTLSDFRMRGSADPRGMQIAEWGGKLFGGAVTGTANVRWSSGWSIDGLVTARGINAAVFAPALLSQGKGEGTGRFAMSGADPSKLGTAGRLEGSFTISSGVLGSFDLGRVLRTSGREYAGSTQFNELTGQATYERGAVSLRNVAIAAGALNAGASADISQSGALSGRIVADVKSSSGGRSVGATLQLGGTIKEPQVRN